jgi:hypothetical protein
MDASRNGRRRARLAPVRLDIVNRGESSARILPERSFLVDTAGQARPPLTAVAIRERLGESRPPAPTLEQVVTAAPNLSGFGLSLATRPADAPPYNRKTGMSLWLAAVLGLDAYPLESRVLNELRAQLPQNPPITSGSAAEGYLLFDATESAGSPAELRLAVERDGQVERLRIPLARGAAEAAP